MWGQFDFSLSALCSPNVMGSCERYHNFEVESGISKKFGSQYGSLNNLLNFGWLARQSEFLYPTFRN